MSNLGTIPMAEIEKLNNLEVVKDNNEKTLENIKYFSVGDTVHFYHDGKIQSGIIKESFLSILNTETIRNKFFITYKIQVGDTIFEKIHNYNVAKTEKGIKYKINKFKNKKKATK